MLSEHLQPTGDLFKLWSLRPKDLTAHQIRSHTIKTTAQAQNLEHPPCRYSTTDRLQYCHDLGKGAPSRRIGHNTCRLYRMLKGRSTRAHRGKKRTQCLVEACRKPSQMSPIPDLHRWRYTKAASPLPHEAWPKPELVCSKGS